MKDDSNTFGIPEFMQEVQETRRKEAAQKELDELKRNSCNGNSGERTRNKKIKVPKKVVEKNYLNL